MWKTKQLCIPCSHLGFEVHISVERYEMLIGFVLGACACNGECCGCLCGVIMVMCVKVLVELNGSVVC